MTPNIPRPEYPRPQFVRADWLCLNGPWQFEIDPGDSGLERGLLRADLARHDHRALLSRESSSRASACTDFHERRLVSPRGADPRGSGRAARCCCTFRRWTTTPRCGSTASRWLRHRGGFTPFTCDLGGVARPARRSTSWCAPAIPTTAPQPRGKQSRDFGESGCVYTRTTGIWQTVWLEPVPEPHSVRPRITPDRGARALSRVELPLERPPAGDHVRARVLDQRARGGARPSLRAGAATWSAAVELAVPSWPAHAVGAGQSAPVRPGADLDRRTGNQVDRPGQSYAGLRSVSHRRPGAS